MFILSLLHKWSIPFLTRDIKEEITGISYGAYIIVEIPS